LRLLKHQVKILVAFLQGDTVKEKEKEKQKEKEKEWRRSPLSFLDWLRRSILAIVRKQLYAVAAARLFQLAAIPDSSLRSE